MIRASALAGRLRLRCRQEGTREDGRFRFSFSPEGRQGLEEAAARADERTRIHLALGGERSVDIAGPPEREFPYDITASQLAAYRFAAASEAEPKPEFRPAPSAAPVTAPMAVLPANAPVPPPPPAPAPRPGRPPAAEVPDLGVLRDVRDGLVKKWQAERAGEFSAAPMPALPGNAKFPPPPPAPAVPAWTAATDREAMERMAGALREVDLAAVGAAREREGMTYAGVLAARAVESPAPDLSRAGQFVADMRFRGGLPLFRKAARAAGWCGLDAEEPRQGWVRWSTARWASRERELADAAYANAMTQALAGMELGDVRVLINERLHAITGGSL